MPQWNADPVGVFTQLLNVTRQAMGWWTAFGKPVPYEVTIPNFFDNGNLLYTENGRTDVFLTWVRDRSTMIDSKWHGFIHLSHPCNHPAAGADPYAPTRAHLTSPRPP